MVRYVHHELRAGLALLAATVAGVAVAGGVYESRQWSADEVGRTAVFALALLILDAVVRGTRLAYLGLAGNFEAADPVTGSGRAVLRGPAALRLLALFLVPAGLEYLWDPAWAILLVLALDSLAKAVAGARWEHRRGRVLWRVPDRDGPWPWKLSYSVSPPPRTRTATDAPPA